MHVALVNRMPRSPFFGYAARVLRTVEQPTINQGEFPCNSMPHCPSSAHSPMA